MGNIEPPYIRDYIELFKLVCSGSIEDSMEAIDMVIRKIMHHNLEDNVT